MQKPYMALEKESMIHSTTQGYDANDARREMAMLARHVGFVTRLLTKNSPEMKHPDAAAAQLDEMKTIEAALKRNEVYEKEEAARLFPTARFVHGLLLTGHQMAKPGKARVQATGPDDKTAGSTVSVRKVFLGNLGDRNNFMSRYAIPKRRQLLHYIGDGHS